MWNQHEPHERLSLSLWIQWAAEIHNTSYVESSSNIESPGFSGGPWWLNFNGSDDVSAIDTGFIGYFDVGQCGTNRCYRNYARLIDTAVWNFFTTYTEL